ncbi:hypothetical protein RND71_014536 [Anisodus tanguticus]|uniref:Uncharacterized protein n=1 Tax=Anisodus tanguticus TaxID=243964 RepID=A0AAE1VK00_9SOLA|nr:hypothetical protein RND71_014536 [Anisodus tanguticus]
MMIEGGPIYTVHNNFITTPRYSIKLPSLYGDAILALGPPLEIINDMIYANLVRNAEGFSLGGLERVIPIGELKSCLENNMTDGSIIVWTELGVIHPKNQVQCVPLRGTWIARIDTLNLLQALHRSIWSSEQAILDMMQLSRGSIFAWTELGVFLELETRARAYHGHTLQSKRYLSNMLLCDFFIKP